MARLDGTAFLSTAFLLPSLLFALGSDREESELGPPHRVSEIEISHREAERALAEFRKYLILHPETELRPKIELAFASHHLASEDYARAKVELEKAHRSALSPEDTRQSLLLLGRVNFGLGDFKRALKDFDEALSLTKERDERSEILFWQGRSLCALGDPEGGQAKFAAALAISPDLSQRGKIAYFSGLEGLKSGASERAERALIRAVLSHPYFVTTAQGMQGLPPEALPGLEESRVAFFWIDEALYALGFSYEGRGLLDRAFKTLSFVPRYFPGSESSARTYLSLGAISSEKKDYSLALSYLRKVQFSGDSQLGSKTLYLTGLCHYRRGEWDEAAQALLGLLNEFRETDAAQDGLLLLGEVRYEMKQYADARRRFRRFLRESPHSVYAENAFLGIAWSYYRQGSYRQAFYKFRDFVTEYPGSNLIPSSKYMTGRSRFNLGDYGKAITIFEDLLREYPYHRLADDAQYLMGRSYLDLNDSARAIVELKKVVLLYPESRLRPSAHKEIGDIHFGRGHYRDAISAYEALEELKAPSHLLDETRYQIERARYRMGLYHSPLDIGRNFAAKYPKSPRSPELQFEVGEYYFRGRRYSEAVQEYKRVIEWFPWSGLVDQARERVAQSFTHLGEYQKAIQSYRELSRKDPPLADRAQFQIGEIYLGLENFDSAIRAFQKLIQEFPRSPHSDASQYSIGICYRKLKRPKEARISFEKLISRYPSSKFAESAYLDRAKTYYEEGDVDGYLKGLSLTVEKTDGRTKAEALFLLGGAHCTQGEFARALDAYAQAAESYGDDFESAADALCEGGRCAKAQADYKTALNMFERAAALIKDARKLRGIEREIGELRSILRDYRKAHGTHGGR